MHHSPKNGQVILFSSVIWIVTSCNSYGYSPRSSFWGLFTEQLTFQTMIFRCKVNFWLRFQKTAAIGNQFSLVVWSAGVRSKSFWIVDGHVLWGSHPRHGLCIDPFQETSGGWCSPCFWSNSQPSVQLNGPISPQFLLWFGPWWLKLPTWPDVLGIGVHWSLDQVIQTFTINTA